MGSESLLLFRLMLSLAAVAPLVVVWMHMFVLDTSPSLMMWPEVGPEVGSDPPAAVAAEAASTTAAPFDEADKKAGTSAVHEAPLASSSSATAMFSPRYKYIV